MDNSLFFRPSLFTIHYFLAHYSLFIMKKCHYSLIIIPHPDPRLLTNVIIEANNVSACFVSEATRNITAIDKTENICHDLKG